MEALNMTLHVLINFSNKFKFNKTKRFCVLDQQPVSIADVMKFEEIDSKIENITHQKFDGHGICHDCFIFIIARTLHRRQCPYERIGEKSRATDTAGVLAARPTWLVSTFLVVRV